MSGAHTPGPWATRSLGPWSTDSEQGSHSSWAIGTRDAVVAIAVTHEHYEDAEYEANARLIAAAPELLAAVAAITAVLGDAFVDEECDAETQLGGYIFGDVMQDAFRDARAAIAKVTGQ